MAPSDCPVPVGVTATVCDSVRQCSELLTQSRHPALRQPLVLRNACFWLCGRINKGVQLSSAIAMAGSSRRMRRQYVTKDST